MPALGVVPTSTCVVTAFTTTGRLIMSAVNPKLTGCSKRIGVISANSFRSAQELPEQLPPIAKPTSKASTTFLRNRCDLWNPSAAVIVASIGERLDDSIPGETDPRFGRYLPNNTAEDPGPIGRINGIEQLVIIPP